MSIEVVEEPLSICVDPAARGAQPLVRELVAFTDGAPPGEERGWSRGVVVADLDADGWPDLVVPRELEVAWMRGGPDGFVPEPDVLATPVEGGIGAAVVDLEGDGDLDVLVLRFEGPPVLLENLGNFSFAWFGAQPPAPEGCVESAAFGDMDLDGDLDLFLGGGGYKLGRGEDDGFFACPSALLEWTGEDWLDRTDELHPDVHANKLLAAGWLEADEDLWPELYVVSDLPAETPGNRLLDNDGEHLWSSGSSMDVKIAGMGLAIGDLNDDGRIDVAVPGTREYRLFMSQPSGWVDYAASAGLSGQGNRGQVQGWGLALQDVDNDGDLDVPVVYGPLSEGGATPVQRDAMFIQTDALTFEDRADVWAWADGWNARGLVVADVNRDGWLDLIKRELGGRVVVDLARCGEGNAIEIALEQAGSRNRFAVGARIEVHAGDTVHRRWVLADTGGHASSGPPEVHVGLGEVDRIDQLRVTWPDGTASTVRSIHAGQRVTLRRER